MESPGVASAFAKAIARMSHDHSRLSHSEEVSKFLERFMSDSARRRRLLSSLLEVIDPNSFYDFSAPWEMTLQEDSAWLVSQFEDARSELRKKLLSRLIARTFDTQNHDLFERIYPIAEAEPILREALRESIGPVDLNSGWADLQRKTYEHNQEWARRSSQIPVSQQIDDLLDRAKAGDAECWWRINLLLGFDDEHNEIVSELDGQVTETPGWAKADPARRRRLLGAARQYLLQADPHTEEWIEAPRNCADRRPLAAYRACRLLRGNEPVFFQDISSAGWKKWAPAILHFIDNGTDTVEARQDLFCNCYRQAPAETLAHFPTMLDRAIDAGISPPTFMDEVAGCFDERLGEILWDRAKAFKEDDRPRMRLVGCLLQVDYPPARAYIEALLDSMRLPGEDLKEDAVLAGYLLVLHAPDCGWETLRPLFSENIDLGREIWMKLGNDPMRDRSALFRLPPSALADLFIWLERSMPWDELPDRSETGHYTPTPLEDLDSLRWGLINYLANAGTHEACDALRQAVRALDEPAALHWRLREAEQNLRKKTFPWPSPADVLQLLDQAPRARLVRSEAEMLEVVIESLGRLQEELQGETPAVQDLWNVYAKKWRPKDENGLSDYVKRFLDRDLARSGVIVNREVEIRRKLGDDGAPGERTDIHVNARVPQTGEELTVIIEVKGCWNDELRTAMETQLVNRYLHDNRCRHGLYLVGWFICQQWDPDDRRRRAPSRSQKANLEASLAAQSRELSVGQDLKVKALVLDATLR